MVSSGSRDPPQFSISLQLEQASHAWHDQFEGSYLQPGEANLKDDYFERRGRASPAGAVTRNVVHTELHSAHTQLRLVDQTGSQSRALAGERGLSGSTDTGKNA
jgi:hypothetical protein